MKTGAGGRTRTDDGDFSRVTRPRLQEAAILVLLGEPTIEAAPRKTSVARAKLLR